MKLFFQIVFINDLQKGYAPAIRVFRMVSLSYKIVSSVLNLFWFSTGYSTAKSSMLSGNFLNVEEIRTI
jgi:hypothetical protein